MNISGETPEAGTRDCLPCGGSFSPAASNRGGRGWHWGAKLVLYATAIGLLGLSAVWLVIRRGSEPSAVRSTAPAKRGPIASSDVLVRNIVVPFFEAGRSERIAMLRVDRLCIEGERRGFVRVGLFRKFVLDGFVLELATAELSSEQIERAAVPLFKNPRGRHLELRKVVLRDVSTGSELRADRGCFADDGMLLLAGQVTLRQPDGSLAEVPNAIVSLNPENWSRDIEAAVVLASKSVASVSRRSR